jgi:uncharacterized protein YndB with AHSA1/START domain
MTDVHAAPDGGFGTLLDAQTIRFVRELPGPIERVWAYLTESDLKATWIGATEIPSTVGGETTMTWEGEDGEPGGGLTIRTRVFDAPHVLEYDWIELHAPGGAIRDSVVRFELAVHGDGVRLTLTHRALPIDSYPTVAAGWHAHLDTLVAQLDGSGGPDAFARYAEIEPRYGALGTFPAVGTVRLERVLPASPERVWAYLTERDLLALWFARGEIPPTVGATSTLTLLAADGAIETSVQVQVYDPPRALAYTMFSTQLEPRPHDPSVVRLELAPHDDGTLLTLTHSAVLPGSQARVGAGWHALCDALAARLRGTEPSAFQDVSNRVIDGYESLAREVP